MNIAIGVRGRKEQDRWTREESERKEEEENEKETRKKRETCSVT